MSEITKYVISVNPERAHIKKFPADLLNLQKSEILFIDASPELMHNLKSMSQEDVDGKLQEGKWVLKYKAVDKKKRPVPSTFPEAVKVLRQFPSDPLEKLPKLPSHAPEFVPTK